ncbi:hypothetical protein RRF57_004333 [Xylaria bambusicola]|uniref:Uncharacterized protein n=1 Tax=Xylaria bambusicola TaxID=326684 RepID=A0AAN7UGD6_9PEZI
MDNVIFRNDSSFVNSSDFVTWQSRKLSTLRFCHIQFEIKDQHEQARISVKQATFCDLTLCVKNYSLSTLNGIPSMDVVSERYGSWYLNTSGQQGNLSYSNSEVWWTDVPERNGMVLNASDIDPYTNLSPRDFALSVGGVNMAAFLNSYGQFIGELTTLEDGPADGRNCASNTTGIHIYKNHSTSSWLPYYPYEDVMLCRIKEKGGLTWAVPRIAAAASSFLRDEGGILVEGQAYRSIITVEVRWPWLALPATTWLCAVVFLALTMWICRGSDKMLWKTSSLPLIYHGFGDQDVATIKSTNGGLEHVSGIEKVSQNLYARIRRDSNDGQLKLMRTLPST